MRAAGGVNMNDMLLIAYGGLAVALMLFALIVGTKT
jgi:hypothetical protein